MTLPPYPACTVMNGTRGAGGRQASGVGEGRISGARTPVVLEDRPRLLDGCSPHSGLSTTTHVVVVPVICGWYQTVPHLR